MVDHQQPQPAAHDNYLTGVSASAANDAWAVGWNNNGGLNRDPVIEHWNGVSWSIVANPSLPGVRRQLYAVTARAANDVWAVGDLYTGGGAAIESLILHWDGAAWTRVTSPNPGNTTNSLLAVTARAANDAWAVGYSLSTNQVGRTMAVHWDGAAWTQVPTVDVGPTGSYLLAVDQRTATDIWAAGYYDDNSVSRTLTERYTDPCVTPMPATATPTPTQCPITFSDVPPTNPFYPFIRCLACRGIISGYSDGTFQWQNNVTRGQLAKILAGAAGFVDAIPTTQQTFEDVPPSNTFWLFVERLAGHSAISGYTCGGAGEPCVPPANRPYFRWGASATRSQIAKIAALAAGYADAIPTTQQSFEDVPSSNPFWLFIEELSSRSIISGYTCGGAGEPCVPPGNRPYFRWGAATTRGQLAKIAAQTFYPNCQTPAR